MSNTDVFNYISSSVPAQAVSFQERAACERFDGASGHGERGGARVIYFRHQSSNRLLMLLAFAKNERSDLTAEQGSSVSQMKNTVGSVLARIKVVA